MTSNPNATHTLARWVLLLCIPPLFLLSPLYVLATPAFVRYEYHKAWFPPATVYDETERLTLAEATVHYLRSDAGPDCLWDLRAESGQEVYNPREVKHMVDVKAVMSGAFRVHGICALLALAAAIFLWRKEGGRSAVLRALYEGSAAQLALLAAVGVVAYFSFDLFFVAFHRVFFQGDSWLFAYTDSLIQLFPVPFWMDATAGLVGLAVGAAILVGGAAYLLSRRAQGT